MKLTTTYHKDQHPQPERGYQVRWYTRDGKGPWNPQYWTITGLSAAHLAQARFDHAEYIAGLKVTSGAATEPLWAEIIDAETGLTVATVHPQEDETE